MKAVVAAFNQEKALVEAFSVIVQPVVEPMQLVYELERREKEELDRERLTYALDALRLRRRITQHCAYLQ